MFEVWIRSSLRTLNKTSKEMDTIIITYSHDLQRLVDVRAHHDIDNGVNDSREKQEIAALS